MSAEYTLQQCRLVHEQIKWWLWVKMCHYGLAQNFTNCSQIS